MSSPFPARRFRVKYMVVEVGAGRTVKTREVNLTKAKEDWNLHDHEKLEKYLEQLNGGNCDVSVIDAEEL